MKERVDKIIGSRVGTALDKFFNSPFYSVAIGAVCILCHSLDIPIIGAALLTLMLVPSLIFCKNTFVLVPFGLMCGFVLSYKTMPQYGHYNAPARIAVLCILLAVAVAALLFNLIYYGKWRVMFKRAYLTVSFALLTGVLIAGGFTSPAYSLEGVGMGIAIAVTSFIPYTLLVNCGEYKGKKTVEYIAWALMVVSVVIGAALLKVYIENNLPFEFASKEQLKLGYTVSNSAAALVIVALPFTFYMVYKFKYGWLFMIAVVLELVIIFMTFSRATLVVAIPGSIIVAVILCFKNRTGRIGYWIAFGVVMAAALTLCVIYRQSISDVISSVLDGNFNDRGRIRLWQLGFEAWKEKPVFGIGLWYLKSMFEYYSFHCTPLTYLYCSGIVGLAVYLYHRYKTVRLVFSTKMTAERWFAAAAMSVIILNALLDIGLSSPLHLIYYSVVLALIDLDVRTIKRGLSVAEQKSQTTEIVPEPEASGASSAVTEVNHERM